MDSRFGRQYHLLRTDDLSSVFALRNRRSHDLSQVSQSGNSGLNHPRLDLVVGEKAIKQVNARNYMKRVIRDWFRRHKEILPPHDFVVRVHRPFTRENATGVREQLAQLMRKRWWG